MQVGKAMATRIWAVETVCKFRSEFADGLEKQPAMTDVLEDATLLLAWVQADND